MEQIENSQQDGIFECNHINNHIKCEWSNTANEREIIIVD